MIPSIADLKDFIGKNQPTNLSKIARAFKIKGVTVSELVKLLEEQDSVTIRKIGRYKFVELSK